MAETGATLFTDALEQYGATHVFGNPGTTELPIMDALSTSSLEYILTLHEDIAVGMAAGYAKTRAWHANRDPSITPIGVVNLHVAPGLAHGLCNLFNSSYIGTGAPLLVTAGAHALEHQPREPNLQGDLVQMADQFTKWSAEVKTVESLPTMLRRAVRVALTPPRGPVFLGLPLDVTMAETERSPERLGSIPDAGPGADQDIEQAAEIIDRSTDLVVVVGDSIGRVGTESVRSAVRFAEATGAGIVGEFRASEVNFPTDHEQWLGRLPDDRREATTLIDADVLILAGTISNVPTNPPDVPDGIPADTTCIQLSEHPWELGKNYRIDVGIVGDPGTVLDRLADRIENESSASVRDRRLESVRSAAGSNRFGSVTPDDDDIASNAQLADALARAAPDARLVSEATTSAKWLQRAYRFEPEQFFKQRGGGLGYGLPAAVGAAIAEGQRSNPRDVIGFIGDGAYLYYPQTIYTAARYGVDLTVVVADNRNYRVLKDNMLSLLGGSEGDYEFVGMDFDPPVDIPANAESHGGIGRLIEDPSAIESAVERAVDEPGPTVLDVLIHD